MKPTPFIKMRPADQVQWRSESTAMKGKNPASALLKLGKAPRKTGEKQPGKGKPIFPADKK